MNVFFNLKAEKADISLHGFTSVELNFADRFLIIVCHESQVDLVELNI